MGWGKVLCGCLRQLLETKVSRVRGAVLARGEAEGGESASSRHSWINSEALYQTQEERKIQESSKEEILQTLAGPRQGHMMVVYT